MIKSPFIPLKREKVWIEARRKETVIDYFSFTEDIRV